LGREDLVKKIKQKRKEGINVIISSHIIQEIEQLADNVAIIDKGKILAQGNLLDLALQNDFNEFEIKDDASEAEQGLEPLFKQLTSIQPHLLGNPLLLSDRIIVKTTSIEPLITLVKKVNINNFIKPLEGTLLKIYKKVLKDEVS
jgi:ABC-type multidrug transport system ATPase subunit